MWMKHALLIGLGLLGFLAIGATLLNDNRLQAPQAATEVALQDPEILQVVHEINHAFNNQWQSRNLTPTPAADDLLIARRISLGLMGTVPSLEEIRVLQSLPPSQRIPWWLDHVFSDRRYGDYVAERLARAFVGTKGGAFILYRRRRFATWLSDQLMQNRPYDSITRDLVAGEGVWTDQPGVNFLTVTIDNSDEEQPDPILLAGKTSRTFLGVRMDCLQCHDDKLGNVALGNSDDPRDGLQSDFHSLAAFFSEAQVSLLGISDKLGNPYRYKLLNAENKKVLQPVVPYGKEWLKSGGSRRSQLAHWITHPENKPFARAMTNRIWALLFGKPLVSPIDDIPLHGPIPPALDLLAEDFILHGYDIQRLISVIVASAPFQRSSQSESGVTDGHESTWAAFPLVRVRPEQIAGAVVQSCSLTTINARSHILQQLVAFFESNDFVQRYGDIGEDEFVPRGGTVTQRLLMMNGNLVKGWTENNPIRNASTRIARLCSDSKRAVDVTFLTVLSRDPTAREQQYFVERLDRSKVNNRDQHLEDLFWVLINSTEFSWSH